MYKERLTGPYVAATLLAIGSLSGCDTGPSTPPTTYPHLTEAPAPRDTVGLGSLPVTAPESSTLAPAEALLSDDTCEALYELGDALGQPGDWPLRIGTGDQTSYVEVRVDPNRVSLGASAVMDALAEGTNTIPVPSDADGANAVHSAVGAVSTAELTVGPVDDIYRLVFDNGVENVGSAFEELSEIAFDMLEQARGAVIQAEDAGNC